MTLLRNSKIYLAYTSGSDPSKKEKKLPFVRFHVPLWTLILKNICNYSISSILLFGAPSFSQTPFLVGLIFCMPFYSFIFTQ